MESPCISPCFYIVLMCFQALLFAYCSSFCVARLVWYFYIFFYFVNTRRNISTCFIAVELGAPPKGPTPHNTIPKLKDVKIGHFSGAIPPPPFPVEDTTLMSHNYHQIGGSIWGHSKIQGSAPIDLSSVTWHVRRGTLSFYDTSPNPLIASHWSVIPPYVAVLPAWHPTSYLFSPYSLHYAGIWLFVLVLWILSIFGTLVLGIPANLVDQPSWIAFFCSVLFEIFIYSAINSPNYTFCYKQQQNVLIITAFVCSSKF